jgi:hypothetical protein
MQGATLGMTGLKFLGVSAAMLASISGCSRESSRRAQSTDTAIAASPRAGRGASVSSDVVTRGAALPPGVKLVSGATIPNTEYVFRRVATPRGDAIWLDSMAQDGGRTPTRTRRADLALPPLAADERVMLASCDVNGRLDPLVIAIVVNEPNVTRFTKIRQAWRANPGSRRFDIIPVGSIVCEDPGS